MASKTDSRRLTRVAEARNSLFEAWKEGVSLEKEFGESIENLLIRVAGARWRLAAEQLRDANLLFRSARPVYRSCVSRYYYAMYHAFRAAALVYHSGDDHQSHTELPRKLPVDLPSVDLWKTKLKEARLSRNRADYEPYPRTLNVWRDAAARLRRDAIESVAATRQYLIAKGCKL